MLFDLRARGRRRTVQAVYLTLAILMGGGLVLFGIGGSVSGGLFDAIGLTDGGSGNSTGGRDSLEEVEKRAAAQTRANPRNGPAWAELARTRFQLAGQGDNYDQAQGTFTARGKAELGQAVAAWERYLALDPPRPDAGTAALMVQAYGALERFEDGVRTAEVVADAQPSSISYFRLAVFAYGAGQTRKADLAGAKAVALAPPEQRAGVRAQIAAVKRTPQAQGAGTGAGATGPTGAGPLPPPASR